MRTDLKKIINTKQNSSIMNFVSITYPVTDKPSILLIFSGVCAAVWRRIVVENNLVIMLKNPAAVLENCGSST